MSAPAPSRTSAHFLHPIRLDSVHDQVLQNCTRNDELTLLRRNLEKHMVNGIAAGQQAIQNAG